MLVKFGATPLENLNWKTLMNEEAIMDMYTLEDFENEFEDDLYIKYMETGTYYDTEYEDFIEWEYESYISELAGVLV